MKHFGRAAALVGLVIAIWLVSREHPATIFRMLEGAGAGLLLAAAVHVLPMLANAWDWGTLIRPAQLAQWLQDAHTVDGIVKGLKQPDWPADPWDALHRMAVKVAQSLAPLRG